MKRSMRPRKVSEQRPAHWRWVQQRYHATREPEKRLVDQLSSYRSCMELRARQQHEYVRAQ